MVFLVGENLYHNHSNSFSDERAVLCQNGMMVDLVVLKQSSIHYSVLQKVQPRKSNRVGGTGVVYLRIAQDFVALGLYFTMVACEDGIALGSFGDERLGWGSGQHGWGMT